MVLSFEGDVKCSLTNSLETKTSFLFIQELNAEDIIFPLSIIGYSNTSFF